MVDLKDFLPGKEESAEYYWAIVLEPEWVQAGIWQIREGKAEVISTSPAIAWGDDEELVGAADTALSSAVQKLAEGAKEPSKTVFGVSSNWVSDGQVKPEYLDKLKHLCSKLSLEPTGFVVLPEAIAHLTKSEEGSPLSAVVLGVSSESLEVSVFRLGNLVGTAQVARSVSLVDDVSEGLSRFAGGDSLPSRFILYDGKEGELEETRQSLLKAQWDDYEKINFLHTPKIEIVTPDRKVVATCLAGASEIADVLSVLAADEKKKTEDEEVPKKETLAGEGKEVMPEDVGFVVGQDVAASTPVTPSQPGIQPDSEQDIKPSTFKERFSFDILSKVKTALTSVFGKGFVKPKLKPPAGKRTFFLGMSVFGVILVAGFVLWWFLPKAVVTIYVAPKKLDEKITILVDTKAKEADFERNILPGKVVDTSVSGEKTKSTTGTRTVGERAKGTVEIRNGTPEAIRLPSGTTITAADDLQFKLDSSASVSAKLSPTDPGKETVEVTAAGIGAEYNLVKEVTFKVGNYLKLDVLAVTTSDFSGGSSRDIAAVSVEDQEILEEELKEELLDKAEQELKLSISEAEFFIDESLVATTSARNFSNKVDDEASSLGLDLALFVSGLVIDKNDLNDLARERLKDSIPSGFVLREDQIEVSFELRGTEDEIFELSAEIVVNLLPEVKPDEIVKKIAGKYPSLASDFLTTIPGFTRAEINLKPNLPGRLGTLPHVVKNIELELAAER